MTDSQLRTVTCHLCGGSATDLHTCEGCGEEGLLTARKDHLDFLTAMRQAVVVSGGESAPAAVIAEMTDGSSVGDTLNALQEAQFVVYDDETDGWWITPPGLAVSGGTL